MLSSVIRGTPGLRAETISQALVHHFYRRESTTEDELKLFVFVLLNSDYLFMHLSHGTLRRPRKSSKTTREPTPDKKSKRRSQRSQKRESDPPLPPLARIESIDCEELQSPTESSPEASQAVGSPELPATESTSPPAQSRAMISPRFGGGPPCPRYIIHVLVIELTNQLREACLPVREIGAPRFCLPY